MNKCVRCRVYGLVQGVFFRASTREQAQRLGLMGYAHNLSDGGVEVLACGAVDKVDQLCDWLWQGPPASSVTTVDCQRVDERPPADFSTG